LAQTSSYGGDIDILNYALVAEYVLSEFYRRGKVQMPGKGASYIQSIGADVSGHIAVINRTIQNLGSSPVQACGPDHGQALSSQSMFLEFALRFENLFARAYLGVAPAVQNNEILQAAAGIYGVEERHAAIVAQLLGREPEGGVYVGAVNKPADKASVLKAIEPYLKVPKPPPQGRR